MRRIPQRQPNRVIRRERDPRALMRQARLLICGLILAGGFIVAAGQHFSAIRYGYQSEQLRHERARLLDEQQRLLIVLDETASPAHLERAARDIGMEPVKPEQIGVAKWDGANSGESSIAHGAPGLTGAPGVALRH